MKKNKSLAELMLYAGKHKYLTYTSWLLSAVSALMALVPFIYIWLIVREILEIMPDFSKAQHIVSNGYMAVIFAVSSMVIYFAGLICSHLAAFRVAGNIRKDAMQKITELPLGALSQMGSGKARRIVNESSAVTETYLAHQLPDMAGALVTPFGMLAMLLFFDWRLGIVSLVPTAISFIIMSAMTGKKMLERMKQYNNALEDMNNEAVEYVRGVPVVKTFGQTVFSFKRFKSSIDNYTSWVTAYTKQLMQPMLIYTTIINSVFALLIAAAILLTSGGKVSQTLLLNIIFYIIFTPIISVTLTKIMWTSKNTMMVDDALRRIHSIIDINPLTEFEPTMLPKDNSVQFKDVSFRYDGATIDAVKNLNIKVAAGSTIALVGPSGGGKTTVASLVSRFWDVTSGRVLVGGADVKHIPKDKLMQTVSYVFQDSKLLKASILENVRLGRPTATETEVLAALKSAQCEDIITKLPDGIHTVIGQKGVFLSGGEQQRIAIARVILKNSPIVVLDEATAFADPQNEYLVQRAFENLAKDRTVIMIAHRLTTIKNADTIYVLKDAELKESGTHEELLKAKGLYSEMYHNYQSSIGWKVKRQEEK